MNSLVRYRKVNHGSNVDESLFGTRTLSGNRKPEDRAVVISKEELAQIRSRAALSDRVDDQDTPRSLEAREARDLKAKERKEHMRQLEAADKNPYDRAEARPRDVAIKKHAEELINENSDAVKLLNSLASRAIAFTIRDKQLEDAHRRAETESEYTRRMDMLMELDRLRELKKREDMEVLKANKRVEDRRTISEQMEERSRARLLEHEAKEQEHLAMRSLMKKYELEEERNNLRKKELIEQSKKEIIEANEEAIRRKSDAREREKKDVEEALLYMALKDQELARREREEVEKEGKKKEAQARLLAQQERAQSNAGKLDELRARRAEEEKERQARRKEKEVAQKRKEEMEVLLRSREEQASLKRERDSVSKSRLKEDYERDLLYAHSLAEKEREETIRRNASNTKHRRDLEEQIRAEEDRRRM
jgi:Trichohyalin-plectin-homology domain